MPLTEFIVTKMATLDTAQRQPITSDFKPRPALLDEATEMITARSVRFMSSDSIGLGRYEAEVPQQVASTNFTPAEGASNAKNSFSERKFCPTWFTRKTASGIRIR